MPEFDDASHSLPKMAELSGSREIILKRSAFYRFPWETKSAERVIAFVK